MKAEAKDAMNLAGKWSVDVDGESVKLTGPFEHQGNTGS